MKKTGKKTSARKASKKAKAAKYRLTVEFAGICCVAPDKKDGAKVLLVDVAKALKGTYDASPHYPSLVIRTADVDATKGSLKPAAALSVPGCESEYALWSLKGAKVEFSDTGAKVGVTWAKGRGAKLVNLAKITGAKSLKKNGAPIAGLVELKTGTIHTKGAPDSFNRLAFSPSGSYRTYAQRCYVEIPFGKEISISVTRGSKSKTLTFRGNTTISIGNQCTEVRKSAVAPKKNHFMAYYKLLRSGKHPRPTYEESKTGVHGADFVTPFCIVVLFLLIL